jgi:beta-galactosidase
MDSFPLIGAEIMDDPAATPEMIDGWFKLLADAGMPLARVFLPREEDALQRMDWFFRAAEKYGVGITATLGGWPSPKTERWIRAVVARYQDSPALDSWILVNEPGQPPEANVLAVEKFREWLKKQYDSIEALNAAWNTRLEDFGEVEPDELWTGGAMFSPPRRFLDWYNFWRSHLTWQLHWIAKQIRAVDARHPTHVNPHALVGNLATMSIDLPAWQPFLDSYGASCHPSWHFGLLGREQYALGVAYLSDLMRGAAGAKPFWITELQGGNNTQSGTRPLYPTPRDIAQWVWMGIGSGAERIIFWLLNNRSFAGESGEWSLLDFQNQPGERLEAAAAVAHVLKEQGDFFKGARPVTSAVTILLSLETMTLQERFEKSTPVTTTERGAATRLEGRGRNAHILEALALYEVFSQLGIAVNIKHMHDFDWQNKEKRQLVILPDVAAVSGQQAQVAADFVRAGNHLLLTGRSGLWDEQYRFWPLASRFPFEDLLGATIKELRVVDEDCQVRMTQPDVKLPAHVWVGEIRNHNAAVIGEQNGWITAVRSQAGQGQAVWIPSLVGLGAWSGDQEPLARLLAELAAPFSGDLTVRFAETTPGCVLRVLQNGKSFVSAVTNGTRQEKRLRLIAPEGLVPAILWQDGATLSAEGEVVLPPRGTLVVKWSH